MYLYGERTLYPVAKIKNYRSDKGAKEIKRGNGRKVCGFLIALKYVRIGENKQGNV